MRFFYLEETYMSWVKWFFSELIDNRGFYVEVGRDFWFNLVVYLIKSSFSI